MPPLVKRRGRPKGHKLTVVGLPSRKNQSTKCTTFISKHCREKERSMTFHFIICPITIISLVILSWFVHSNVIEMAMNGNLIEEELVKCRPQRITSAVLDEDVDINLVRHHFSYDAWLVVEDVVQRKKDRDLWICNVCQHELDGNNIICESCLYGFISVVLVLYPNLSPRTGSVENVLLNKFFD